jgi:hypothetical protein
MTTVKSETADTWVNPLSEVAVFDRTEISRQHAALFPARLALARWGSPAGLPHLHDAAGAHVPLRAAWLVQAQQDFQAWLENGGFIQHEELASAPSGDQRPTISASIEDFS